jgi:hypothetical protein
MQSVETIFTVVALKGNVRVGVVTFPFAMSEMFAVQWSNEIVRLFRVRYGDVMVTHKYKQVKK